MTSKLINTEINASDSELPKLEQALNYKFNDIKHLRTATTHSSYDHLNSYERYEFLGDSVVNMIVAKHLFNNAKELNEGQLTKIRSALVCSKSLAIIANKLNLGHYILLSKGEVINNGRKRASILEDAVEAVCGAIYLDSGSIETVEAVMIPHFIELINSRDVVAHAGLDNKSFLQEIVQELYRTKPQYAVLRTEGKSHNQTFYVHCVVEEAELSAVGVGLSKRAAEQQAASRLIAKIEENGMLPEQFRAKFERVKDSLTNEPLPSGEMSAEDTQPTDLEKLGSVI